jgi:hypothetical protein
VTTPDPEQLLNEPLKRPMTELVNQYFNITDKNFVNMTETIENLVDSNKRMLKEDEVKDWKFKAKVSFFFTEEEFMYDLGNNYY